jgi:hypothetical protein
LRPQESVRFNLAADIISRARDYLAQFREKKA